MRAGARMAMRTRGVRMEALQRCVPPAGVLLHTLALLACNPLGAHQPRQLSAASRRASVRMIGHGVLPGSKTAPSLRGGVPYRSYTATSSRLVLWGGGGGGDRGKREEFSDVDIEDVGKSAEAGALMDSEAKEIADALVEWYSVNKRDLPWRDQARWPQPPYAVWVSEIMLQQTRVATVVDYFCRWMDKWPTVEKLAAASEEEVNEMWSGLGYYRRARMLHQGARTVVQQFNGQLPTTVQGLKSIPGIGDYTAGAIASIAFSQRVPLVDGNVVRLLARLRMLSRDPKAQAAVKQQWELAGTLVRQAPDPASLNQAYPFTKVNLDIAACGLLMEMGATVCTPKSPLCTECPIAFKCKALHAQTGNTGFAVTDLPPKVTKAAPRPQTVAVCLLVEETAGESNKGNEGEEAASWSYLVVQRPHTGLLASLWEFPTVPVAEGASRLACRQALGAYLDQAAAIHRLQSASQRSASQSCSASSRAREQRRQAAAAAAEGEDEGASAGGHDLARHMRYVGQVNFLFSHIKQTLEVFKIVMTPGSRQPNPTLSTLVSLSNSAGARVSEAVGQHDQHEQHVKPSSARGAGRGKVKSKKTAHGQGGDETQVERQDGKEDGGAEQVGQPSPPNALRWLADDALDSAALPTVMRRVLSLHRNPDLPGGKGVKRPRPPSGRRPQAAAPAADSKQKTLSHFFARSAAADS